ncbi:hypothetical protein LTR85_008621 [Meristemomyces frigidus]|nr:hypothetical protein LTR85_008621 [Meristemomyces frigidus]
MVTGSSDGIGKGFAEELCHRGFNVVLHGRNERKLNAVRDALLKRWPQREVRVIVFDAINDLSDSARLEATVASLRDIEVRILVNNIASAGTSGRLWRPLADTPGSDVAQMIDVSTRFPTDLTRLLLPQLVKSQPALIMNIGSGASEAGTPYVSVLSATKAFTKQWSRSLKAEMAAERHDVEVICIMVGMVATTPDRKTTFLVPSPRQMAKGSLDVVGCGRCVTWGYWPHALQFGTIFAMPEWLVTKLITGIAKKEKAAEEAKMKQR